jgi:hypothetical protein
MPMGVSLQRLALSYRPRSGRALTSLGWALVLLSGQRWREAAANEPVPIAAPTAPAPRAESRSPALPLALIADVPLPGRAVRFDYQI